MDSSQANSGLLLGRYTAGLRYIATKQTCPCCALSMWVINALLIVLQPIPNRSRRASLQSRTWRPTLRSIKMPVVPTSLLRASARVRTALRRTPRLPVSNSESIPNHSLFLSKALSNWLQNSMQSCRRLQRRLPRSMPFSLLRSPGPSRWRRRRRVQPSSRSRWQRPQRSRRVT